MPRNRTFLAVELSPQARAAATELQQQLARTSAAAVNWVEPANLHVTLMFLGDVEARELVPLCKILQRVADDFPLFGLRLGGVGAFPNPRRPKTVYAGLTEGGGELRAIHAALQPPLLDLGVTRQEERAYTPHLTLGRVRGEAEAEKLSAALPQFQNWTGGTSAVGELTLFTSELRRGGPEYAAVSRALLGG